MPGLSFTIQLGLAPAPSEVIDAVQAIEVESSTEIAGAFRLRLGISQTPLGDWTLLEQDLFRPLTPLTIHVSNAQGLPEALINGYVGTQHVSYSTEPGGTVLEVSGMDITLMMNLEEKVQPWPNLPDTAIAAAIFGQYAVVPRTGSTTPQFVEPQGTTTQRATDIRFLKRLAQRNGFDCFVQPEPISGIDQGYFQAPDLTGLPEAVLNVNSGPQTNVQNFQVTYDMSAPTGAIALGIDVSDKSVQTAIAPASLQVPLGLEPSLLRLGTTATVQPAGTGLMVSGELQPFAQAIADRSSFALVAEGSVDPDVGLLRPGGIVNIRGAGRLFSGSYYLTRVTHTITRENHVQRFRGKRNAVTLTGAEVFVEL
jgi:hypothetical protein